MHQKYPMVLEDFLLGTFDNDELRSFLMTTFDPTIGADLPSSTEPRRQYVSACVELLARRGMLDAEFFVALGRERPRRAHEICQVMLARAQGEAPWGERTASPNRRPRARSGAIATILVVSQILALCEYSVAEVLHTQGDSAAPARDEAVRTVVHESAWRMNLLHGSIRETVGLVMDLVTVDPDLEFLVLELHDLDMEAGRVVSTLDWALSLVGTPRAAEPSPMVAEKRRGVEQERLEVSSPRLTPLPPLPDMGRRAAGSRPRPATVTRVYEEEIPVMMPNLSVTELRKIDALYRAQPHRAPGVVAPSVKAMAVPRRSAPTALAPATRNARPDVEDLRKTRTARFNRHKGSNVTSYCVGTDGRTTHVQTRRGFPGDPEVDRICRETVEKWRFAPILDEHGRPIELCREAEFELDFGAR